MRRILALSSIALQLLSPLTSALSLNTNFQSLKITVPVACAAAYSKQIPNCNASDFGKDTTCSSDCIVGLNQTALQIIAACSGVRAESKSLLGIVFLGGLVSELCPNNDAKQSKTSTKQSTTRATATTTLTAKSTSATASTSTTSPDTTTTSTGTTTSSLAAQTTDTVVSTNTASTLMLGSQTQSQSTSVTSTPSPIVKLTAAQQQILAMRRSGGGSPFDIVGYSGGHRIIGSNYQIIWTAVFALGVGILLVGAH